MNIAFLYSGHLRSFYLTQSKHNDLIQKLLYENHDVKLFGHTWNNLESSSKSWWKEESKMQLMGSQLDNIPMNNFQWNVIKVEDEKEFSCPIKDFNSQISYEGIYSMFYGWTAVYEVYCEFKNSNKWNADILLKLRFDIDFDIEKITSSINSISKSIIVNKSQTWGVEGAFSDILFIGPESELNFSLALSKFESNKVLKSYFKRYNTFVPELFVSKFVFGDAKFKSEDFSLYIVRDEKTRINVFDSKLAIDHEFIVTNKNFAKGLKEVMILKIIRFLKIKIKEFWKI